MGVWRRVAALFLSWIAWIWVWLVDWDAAVFLCGALLGPVVSWAVGRPRVGWQTTGLTFGRVCYCVGVPAALVAVSARWYYCSVDPVTLDECAQYWRLRPFPALVEYAAMFVVNFPLCFVQEAAFRTLFWRLEHGAMDSGVLAEMRLQKMSELYTPLEASLAVGALHALWHLPLFFFAHPHRAGHWTDWGFWVQFAAFGFYTSMLAVFLGGLYNETGADASALAEARGRGTGVYPHRHTVAKLLATTLASTSVASAMSVGGVPRLRFFPAVLGAALGVVNVMTGRAERGGWGKLASARVFLKDHFSE